MIQVNQYYDLPEFGKNCYILECGYDKNSIHVKFKQNNKITLISRSIKHAINWKISK